MASPPPAWSVTVCLRHRGGLEIHAAAENVLPGGGTAASAFPSSSASAAASASPSPPNAAALPRPPSPISRAPARSSASCGAGGRECRGSPSVWRRKKPPVRAAAAKPGSRSQNRALMRPAHRERVWTAKATSVLCFVAVLAVAAASIAVFRFTTRYHCTSWRCYLTERFVEFLEPPPLYEWLPKLSLKWLLNK